MSAALIYLTASDEIESAAAMQEMFGSKTYIRELQRFGGKASVIFDEFSRWFAALWRGKSLGITIAWLSVAAAGGLFVVARSLPDEKK